MKFVERVLLRVSLQRRWDEALEGLFDDDDADVRVASERAVPALGRLQGA